MGLLKTHDFTLFDAYTCELVRDVFLKRCIVHLGGTAAKSVLPLREKRVLKHARMDAYIGRFVQFGKCREKTAAEIIRIL